VLAGEILGLVQRVIETHDHVLSFAEPPRTGSPTSPQKGTHHASPTMCPGFTWDTGHTLTPQLLQFRNQLL
jgi:hypothetical protein